MGELWKSKKLAQVVSNIGENVGHKIGDLDKLSSKERKVKKHIG